MSVLGTTASRETLAEPEDHPRASEPVLVYKLIRYTLADGTVMDVETTPDIADIIKRLDASAASRERRQRERETCCTDLEICDANGRRKGLDPHELTEGHARRHVGMRMTANPWTGPRFCFDLVLGVDLVGWAPRIELSRPCPVCDGRTLATACCCLACGRTGCDGLIPGLTAAERAAFERAARGVANGPAEGNRKLALKGGLGGCRRRSS